MRYFEDFHKGDVFELGVVKVDEAEILAFGRRYDPQPFHVDPEAARKSSFGGLIASGWLSASLFMRQYVEELLLDSACEGSPGVDEVRYVRPVRPGDVLTARLTVLATSPFPGKPEVGLVRPRCELLDADERTVFSMVLHSLFRRRVTPEDSTPTIA